METFSLLNSVLCIFNKVNLRCFSFFTFVLIVFIRKYLFVTFFPIKNNFTDQINVYFLFFVFLNVEKMERCPPHGKNQKWSRWLPPNPNLWQETWRKSPLKGPRTSFNQPPKPRPHPHQASLNLKTLQW